jgi:CubicO group peptidase (beta-lactamase class C family)
MLSFRIIGYRSPAADYVFLKPPLLVAGGGGLVSTARDYASFGAMLLNDGALDGRRVIEVETARTARSNLLRVHGPNGPLGGDRRRAQGAVHDKRPGSV